jgi:hypothetical protein
MVYSEQPGYMIQMNKRTGKRARYLNHHVIVTTAALLRKLLKKDPPESPLRRSMIKYADIRIIFAPDFAVLIRII